MLRSLVRKFEQSNGSCLMIGWHVEDSEDCKAYFCSRVTAKLREWNGAALLQEYLVGLEATGFDVTILKGQIIHPPPPQDWEIGEAFAEVFLEDHHEAFFPWPRSFDKRTPMASLPGPDLVGFHRKEQARFLFGEVKSSSQDDPRSVVIYNEDSLLAQLLRLVNSEAHRQQLIQWMLARAKGSAWQPAFDMALKRYYTAPQGRSWIVGVVVRGGNNPSIDELAKAHEELASGNTEFDIMLVALYLPFHKDEWVGIVYAGGDPK